MTFNAGDIQGTLTLDRSPFQQGLDAAKAEAREFADQRFAATLAADETEFSDRLRFAQDRGDEFSDATYRAALTADTDQFTDELRFAEARGDEFADRRYEASLDLNTSPFDRAMAEALAKAEVEGKSLGDAASKGASESASSGGMDTGKLLVAGIAAALSAAGGLIAVGAAGLFAGIAIAADKNNQQVQSSFQELKTDALSSVEDAASGVTGRLVPAIQSLDREVVGVGPQLRTMFNAAGADIPIFTTGVEALVNNTLPGLTRELTQSKAAATGFASLLASTGTGLSGFFGILSTDTQSQGQVLQDLGSIAQSVLPTVASLLNDLTNIWANDSSQIVGLVRTLDSSLTGLAGGAVSSLSAGFGGMISTVTGVLQVLRPLDSEIGVGIGMFTTYRATAALADATIGKLGASVSGSSDKVKGYITNLTGSAAAGENAASATGKLGGALTSMGNALPYVAAGYSLLQSVSQSVFGSQQQLSSQLLSGGNAAQTASAQIAKNAATQQALESTGNGVEAFYAEHFIPTMSDVTDGMSDVQKAQVNYNLAVAKYGANSTQAEQAAKAMAQAVSASSTSADAAATAQTRLNVAAATSSDSAVQFGGAVGNLVASLSTLGDKSSSDAQKISALQTAIESIINPSGSANAALLQMSSGVDGVTSALQNNKGPLVDASGQFDAMSARGNATAQAIEQVGTSMATYATQAEAAGTPTATIQQHLQQVYSTLENQLLPAFHGNKAAVDGFLSSLGVPAPTAFLNGLSPALDKATAQVDLLKNHVVAIPNNKTIIVQGLTQDAISKLQDLGLRVTRLPNGQFKITADNGQALNSLEQLLNKADGAQPKVRIGGDISPANQQLQQMINRVNAAIGIGHIHAEDSQGQQTLYNLLHGINSATGTSHIHAESSQGSASLFNLLHGINSATGTAHIGADASPARGVLGGLLSAINSAHATVHVSAQASLGGVLGAHRGGGTTTEGHQAGLAALPHYATGGTTSSVLAGILGGGALVGENGPEIIFPSFDNYISTASQSRDMLSGIAHGLSGLGSGNSGIVSLDDQTIQAMAQAFAQAIGTATLRFDPNGLVRLVTQGQMQAARR